MTDEAKALVELRVLRISLANMSDSEFAVACSGEFCEDIKGEIEGCVANGIDLIETQAREIERLRIALQGISEFGGRHPGHGYSCHLLARAALGESHD